MALITFEGFDALTATPADASLMPGWTGSSGLNYAKVAGQLGGSVLSADGYGNAATYLAPSNLTTAYVGLRYRVESGSPASLNVFSWYDSANAAQCGISINASSQLIA